MVPLLFMLVRGCFTAARVLKLKLQRSDTRRPKPQTVARSWKQEAEETLEPYGSNARVQATKPLTVQAFQPIDLDLSLNQSRHVSLSTTTLTV